jgi:hypothetical protein
VVWHHSQEMALKCQILLLSHSYFWISRHWCAGGADGDLVIISGSDDKSVRLWAFTEVSAKVGWVLACFAINLIHSKACLLYAFPRIFTLQSASPDQWTRVRGWTSSRWSMCTRFRLTDDHSRA